MKKQKDEGAVVLPVGAFADCKMMMSSDKAKLYHWVKNGNATTFCGKPAKAMLPLTKFNLPPCYKCSFARALMGKKNINVFNSTGRNRI